MNFSSRNRGRASSGPWLLLLAVLAGCGGQDIRVYDAPKEPVEVRATLPEGWKELPANQMQVANFEVTGNDGAKAQMTIVPLPGSAGNELDNVNRWRGQVGLPPIAEAELGKDAVPIQIAGASARMFEMSGTSTQTRNQARLLAASQKHGDSVWFFKLMGDDELVRQQRDAFVNFLAKYQYRDGEAAGPADSPPARPESRTAQTEPPRRSWTPPAGWQQQQPGPMQDAKFLAAGGKAIVTVSILDGPAGGILANVNRWRTAQLGLPAVDEAALASLVTPLDLPDTKAKLVDMTGPNQRMVAAIISRSGSTWFFKLMGENEAVSAEKNSFIEFVKTAK